MNLYDQLIVHLIQDIEFKKNIFDVASLIKNIQKNKISLKFLVDKNKNNRFFLDDINVRKEYQKEVEQCNNWTQEFIVIKNEWEKKGIDYIFHKSIGDFPYLSDNLDVLVKEKDFLEAGEILKKLGYTDLRNIQEQHKEFYRKFDGLRVVCPIHLHSRVCWGVPYEDNEHLWRHYRVSNQNSLIHYPESSDAILINIAHCFLEDHQIKFFDLLIIKESLINGDIDWDYIYKTSEKMRWRQSLHSGIIILDSIFCKFFKSNLFKKDIVRDSWRYIDKKKWISNKIRNDMFKKQKKMPFNIPHLWTRIHSSLRILKDNFFGSKFMRFQIVLTSLIDGFIHNKLKIKTHAPLFVVFSGLDGAGKSSHIEVLIENHQKCDINSRAFWSRAGSFPIINKILKIIRFFKKKDKFYGLSNRKHQKKVFKNKIALSFWRLFNCIEMILLYFFKIRIPLFFCKSIIADRYIYDSIIDIEILSNSSRFNRAIYRFVCFFSPKPDVIINLDVDVDKIIERGADDSKKDLLIKKAYYDKFFKDMNIINVDNNGDFNIVNSMLTNISLTKLFNKHPNKFKGYRVSSFKYK